MNFGIQSTTNLFVSQTPTTTSAQVFRRILAIPRQMFSFHFVFPTPHLRNQQCLVDASVGTLS